MRLMFGVLDFLLRNYAPPAYSLQVSQGKREKIKETMEDYDKPPTFIHLTPSSVSSVFSCESYDQLHLDQGASKKDGIFVGAFGGQGRSSKKMQHVINFFGEYFC